VAQDLVGAMSELKDTLSACSSEDWWDDLEEDLEDLIKDVPDVRAAEILWEGFNIVDDLDNMYSEYQHCNCGSSCGGPPQPDACMKMGNYIGDIVKRASLSRDARERAATLAQYTVV
jgi:hypothetical protein